MPERNLDVERTKIGADGTEQVQPTTRRLSTARFQRDVAGPRRACGTSICACRGGVIGWELEDRVKAACVRTDAGARYAILRCAGQNHDSALIFAACQICRPRLVLRTGRRI